MLSAAIALSPGPRCAVAPTAPTMCGRYTLRSRAELLQQVFGLPSLPGLEPRYNIAPSQPVPVVRVGPEGRALEQMRWGLVPFWAEDPAVGNRMINARAETAATKPAFREPFRRRRCLMPADGFYEWQETGSGRKQPWFLCLPDGEPFAFAAIWDRWRGTGGTELRSCCLLTTGPNDVVEPIHDRMPVLLAGSDARTWLDEDAGVDDLLGLCRPYAGAMKATPVTVRVNDPAHDAPDCLEPISRPPVERRLFD